MARFTVRRSRWASDARRGASAAIALSLAASPTPSLATTLQEALVAAYGGNPTLTAQRAALRATDEEASYFRAQGRPQIAGNGSIVQGFTGLRDVNGYNRAIQAGGQVTFPLYQGGRVSSQIHAADKRSEAGRADLISVEGQIFVQVVTAYMDVLRDRTIVDLNEHNITVLETDVTSSQRRFKDGDLTRTDVAQSKARLDVGRAELATARANLVSSEEAYRRVVGSPPVDLAPPPPLPPLPDTVEAAEDIAIANNPDVQSTQKLVRATRYDVDVARDSRNPTVTASAAGSYYQYQDRFAGIGNVAGTTAQGQVTVTVPIYQGGQVGAQVRRAKDLESQAVEQETAAERQTVAVTRASFSSYLQTLAAITANQEAIESNQLALKGVRAENRAGLRQVLDVLNAELELLNSEVSLETTKHDSYVAAFQLLNAMGYANYKRLGLSGGVFYDPQVNFRDTIHSRGDLSYGPRIEPIAKSTYVPGAVAGQ